MIILSRRTKGIHERHAISTLTQISSLYTLNAAGFASSVNGFDSSFDSPRNFIIFGSCRCVVSPPAALAAEEFSPREMTSIGTPAYRTPNASHRS